MRINPSQEGENDGNYPASKPLVKKIEKDGALLERNIHKLKSLFLFIRLYGMGKCFKVKRCRNIRLCESIRRYEDDR